ncbi:hypothetical protein [Rubripirellula tenax]|uniref:hypothetical protein n=1 Tax=Rubripirellula tenax TaxID=2528015 RepID=UPI0011B3BDAF|nr:hypothetical protein [Rubripirellula tenax]
MSNANDGELYSLYQRTSLVGSLERVDCYPTIELQNAQARSAIRAQGDRRMAKENTTSLAEAQREIMDVV